MEINHEPRRNMALDKPVRTVMAARPIKAPAMLSRRLTWRSVGLDRSNGGAPVAPRCCSPFDRACVGIELVVDLVADRLQLLARHFRGQGIGEVVVMPVVDGDAVDGNEAEGGVPLVDA